MTVGDNLIAAFDKYAAQAGLQIEEHDRAAILAKIDGAGDALINRCVTLLENDLPTGSFEDRAIDGFVKATLTKLEPDMVSNFNAADAALVDQIDAALKAAAAK